MQKEELIMKTLTESIFMNNFNFINALGVTFFLVLIFSFQVIAQNVEPADMKLTGQQLWEKCISYHDPEGKWLVFEGKVHINTIRSKSDISGAEILQIQKPEDFYQSTIIDFDVKAIKGIKEGKCFHAVNGNYEPSDEQIEKYKISCEDASISKEHHTCHFGLPMQLKTSGVVVQEKVKSEIFYGTICHVLTLIGETSAVKHPYYEGTWQLYIDPVSYAMKGLRWQSEEHSGIYEVFINELEVGGIIMPQVKVVFMNEDDSHYYTDIFTHAD
jgi:hypothetical protein